MLIGLSHRLRQAVSGEGLKARLIRGGLGSVGIQAANRVLGLALGIVLARTLGVEGYGVYTYAFAIMGLLMVVAEAGVPTLLMREVAASLAREEWGLVRGVVRRAGQFVSFAATTVSLIGLLVLWAVGDRLSSAMFYTTALMLLVLPLAAGTKTLAHALKGLHRVVLGQAVNLFLPPLLVLALVGTGFLLWPELRQPQYAMAAQLVGAGIVLATSLFILRRLMPSEATTAAPLYRSREWLRSALPFTLIGGAGIINSQTDIIMLGLFNGPKEVGIYRIAVQGATLVALSVQVASTVVAPEFSRFYAQGDMARLQRMVVQSARVALMVAMPVALTFILGGAVIISWVFGAEYTGAQVPLAILAIAHLTLAIIGLAGPLLSMTGFEKLISKSMWISALANIVLNLMLIPKLGEIGAAVSTVVTLIGWNIYLCWLAKTRLGVKVFPL